VWEADQDTHPRGQTGRQLGARRNRFGLEHAGGRQNGADGDQDERSAEGHVTPKNPVRPITSRVPVLARGRHYVISVVVRLRAVAIYEDRQIILISGAWAEN